MPERNGGRSNYAETKPNTNGHCGTEIGRMTFRPNGKDVVVESPQELVSQGFYVSQESVQSVWGDEGLKSYNEARDEKMKKMTQGEKIAEAVRAEPMVNKTNA